MQRAIFNKSNAYSYVQNANRSLCMYIKEALFLRISLNVPTISIHHHRANCANHRKMGASPSPFGVSVSQLATLVVDDENAICRNKKSFRFRGEERKKEGILKKLNVLLYHACMHCI